MKFILGLGNPGEEYKYTRHNAGRLAVDFFVEGEKLNSWKVESKKEMGVASGTDASIQATFYYSLTYMNESGRVAERIMSKQKKDNLVVIHDDVDIPIGKVKISFGRGSGGHNGVESIISTLKTKNFTRIRIGIAPQRGSISNIFSKLVGNKKNTRDLVLEKFSKSELETLNSKVFPNVGNAIKHIAKEGVTEAMNIINRDK